MKMHEDLKLDARFPNFALPDQDGKVQQLSQYMRGFPTVVTFYRGTW